MLLMPFVGGVLADRMDRRKLLLITEFSLAILWAGMSLVITLGFVQWWHLLITGVLSGIIQSLGRPGHQAMLGSVVEHEQLAGAVAADNAIDHWSHAVGLLVATIAIPIAGTEGLFWTTATLQLLTGFTLLCFSWQSKPVEESKKSVKGNLIDGIKYVKGEPVILGLVGVAAAASLFGGAYHFLMPFFARDILGVGAQGLGTLLLASTLGTTTGAAAVFAFVKESRRGLILLGAAMLTTVMLVGFSRSEIFVLSLGLMFGMGLFSTVKQTMSIMIMQILAPDHMRGRVMGLRVSIMGLSWIGVLMMGAVAEVIGPANTVLYGGLLSGFVVAVLFIAVPSLWRLK